MTKSISTAMLFLMLLVAIGCNDAKQMADSSNDSASAAAAEQVEQTMSDNGFKKAVVIKTDADAPCDFQIQLVGSDMLDPTELDGSFKKNNLEVWVKYLGLRKQNRCERNVPVDILAIEKR